MTGEPRPMDLIVDELGGVVVNSVHAGASAQASRRGARWKDRLGPYGFGILGYPIGAAMAAVRPPFVRLRIEADGEVVSDMDQHILMIAIGNGTSVGGGTELTPDADPEDGKLDVMVSFATGPLERLAYVWQLRSGEHEERDDVISMRAQPGHRLRRGLLPRRRRRDQRPRATPLLAPRARRLLDDRAPEGLSR